VNTSPKLPASATEYKINLMKKLTTLLTLIIFTSNYCFSKEKQPSPLTVQTKPVVPTMAPATNKVDSLSAVTYKMLYDNQVKYNSEILKTIFYALSGLASAALLVIGSNVVFNVKKVRDVSKENDKKVKDAIDNIDTKIKSANNDALVGLTEKINTLSSEKTSEISQTQIKLQEEVTASITNITTKVNEFIETIRAEIKEDNKTLLNNYQSQLTSFSENINIQIATLKTSIDERVSVVQKTIDINNEEVEKSITEIKKEIDLESKKAKINIYNGKAALWTIKGNFLVAFMYYLEEGMLSIEIKYDWNLKFIFKDLEEILQKITYVKQGDIDRFKKFIDMIPLDTYVVEKANIVDSFNKIPVKA